MRDDRVYAAILVLFVVAGIALRFVALDHQVFWHDEVYTRFFAAGYQAADWKPALFTGHVLDVEQVLRFQHHNPDKGVVDTVLGLARDEPQHPPLYYVLLRAWVGAFGDSVTALRAMSATLSLLGLPAIYWFCRELFKDRRVALTAVALLAVSPFFVLYAREAREYILWSVLVLASCAALLTAVRRAREPRSWLPWLAFSILTTLALYTSFSSVAVIMAQVVYVVVIERGRPNRVSLGAAGAMGVSAVVFAPWAYQLWQHFEAFQASMAWSRTIIIPRTELLATFALNLSRPIIDFWPGLDGPAACVGVALAVGLLMWALSELRHASGSGKWLLWLIFAAPIVLLLGPDLLWGGIRSVSTRYLTPCLLVAVIATAWAVARPRRAGWVRPAVGVVVLVTGLGSVVHNTRQQAVWSKGISRSLPEIARIINASERPLVVGNMEQHHPGNLLALCHILKPGTKLQFLTYGVGYETRYDIPDGYSDVFLYSPIPPFLDGVERLSHGHNEQRHQSLYMSLWVTRPAR